MLKIITILLVSMIIACVGRDPSLNNNVVMTVDYLVENGEQYRGKIVNVRGRVGSEYHGTFIEGDDAGFFVVTPERIGLESGLESEKNQLYEDFWRLSREVRVSQMIQGKGEVFATIRGRYDIYLKKTDGEEVHEWGPEMVLPYEGHMVFHRLVLLEVLNLEVIDLNGE
jgi:hypothetical protein